MPGSASTRSSLFFSFFNFFKKGLENESCLKVLLFLTKHFNYFTLQNTGNYHIYINPSISHMTYISTVLITIENYSSCHHFDVSFFCTVNLL